MNTTHLKWHGYECEAVPCGTLAGVQLYFISLSPAKAIVRRAAQRATAAGYTKARAVVYMRTFSSKRVDDIAWDGPAADAARAWAARQCEARAGWYMDPSEYRAELRRVAAKLRGSNEG